MIEHIKNYIGFLSKTLNFSVTIHSVDKALTNVIYDMPQFNIHSDSYCLYIKSHPEMWNKCIRNQSKIYERLNENGCSMFYGSCYAGVGEYIYPVSHKKEIYGFISVGRYRGNKEKMLHTAEKYLTGATETEKIYLSALNGDVPDFEFVRTVTAPLAAMLLLSREEKPAENYSETENTAYRALSYVHRNFCTDINLEKTALFAGCSVRTLSAIFRKAAGMSVCSYIEKLRMEKAEKLIKETNVSVTETAFLCGYSDPNYFSCRFSRYFGISPSIARKTRCNGSEKAKVKP